MLGGVDLMSLAMTKSTLQFTSIIWSLVVHTQLIWFKWSLQS